jgi:hypothetical protein
MRAPAAPVDLESSLLKAKKRACRLQHCTLRPISVQVPRNMLAEMAKPPTFAIMMEQISFRAAGIVLVLSLGAASAASAGDQARTIINSIDPKSMNELFEALPHQPDAALTNIMPVSPNKFRFLFIWPASNPLMTYDRVGRSFAERFALFANQMQPLAIGFCLPAPNIFFGTTTYGEEEVNVAYRDIEVHYQFGWQPPCEGRYIKAAEIEQLFAPQRYHGGFGALPPDHPGVPPAEPRAPEEGLKPFLPAPAPARPLQ